MCRLKPKAEDVTEARRKTLWQPKSYPKHKVTLENSELCYALKADIATTQAQLSSLLHWPNPHTEGLQRQGMPISRLILFTSVYGSK